MSATSSAQTFQSLQPGSQFGSYDVVRCIGIGGMGAVFEATHRLLDRRVALKVMHGESRDGFDLRERFLREGATLVRVKHPNVVTVYDAGIVNGMPYLAMELLDGQGLDRVIEREARLAPDRAVGLLAPIADGLAAVHAEDLVHRDIKAENLFVTSDAAGHELVKIIDFGIAKEVNRTGVRNTVVGTPHYMPPEQLFGGAVLDGRADQYALACVLYEALTGTLPYDGNSVLDLAMNVERGGAPPPSLRGGGAIPVALDAVVLRALSKEPSDRYETMHAFHEALLEAVPSGAARRSAASISMSAELDISAEVLRSREFPTIIEPLAPALPEARTGHVTDASAFAKTLPPPSVPEKSRRSLTIAATLALAAALAIGVGLTAARMGRSSVPSSAPVPAAVAPPTNQVAPTAPIVPAVAVPTLAAPSPSPAPASAEVPAPAATVADDAPERAHVSHTSRRSSTTAAPSRGASPSGEPSIRLAR